jgi:hypothetical protein
MHNGEHYEQYPRLQPGYGPPLPDLAAMVTDNPPPPGASDLAAVATHAMERSRASCWPNAEYGEQAGQQYIQRAHYALEMCRNPADQWRNVPGEHSLAGENVFVLQQDPWLAAAVSLQQQQQQEALPAVVQGVWPELAMIPHSCAPNTTAPVMHKVCCALQTSRPLSCQQQLFDAVCSHYLAACVLQLCSAVTSLSAAHHHLMLNGSSLFHRSSS